MMPRKEQNLKAGISLGHRLRRDVGYPVSYPSDGPSGNHQLRANMSALNANAQVRQLKLCNALKKAKAA
jgi:hypothetical protein